MYVASECLAEENFSHQELLVSKTIANSCWFAFFIVHIINLEGKSWQSIIDLPNLLTIFLHQTFAYTVASYVAM